MRLALSNRCLPVTGQLDWLPRLPDLQLTGIELDPRHAWPDAGLHPAAAAVTRYGQRVNQAGLQTLGLQLELTGSGWFGDADECRQLQQSLVHLSAVCRDLGGHTLILAGGRWRQTLATRPAWLHTADFFEALLPRIETHGTCIGLAPVSRLDGDFCNSATDCRILADALDHPAFGLQLNAQALADSGEIGRHAVFASHYGRLEVFTANEPGLARLGSTGLIDHAALRRHLAAGGFRNWVCMQQQPAATLEQDIHTFTGTYLRPDNLTLQQHLATL